MTEKLTKQRILELLEDIRKYEQDLTDNDNDPRHHEISLAWTTLAIAKAKLKAMQGDRDD